MILSQFRLSCLLHSDAILCLQLEWLPSQWPPEGLSWQMQAKAYVIPVMALSLVLSLALLVIHVLN